jgi:acyl-CoA thioester hydrolase
MYSAETTYRVLYADIDQMGYMYYGQYAKLFEIGRVEALRSLGLSYKEVEDQGIWMPVYEVNSRYIEPARYDDLLTIKTTIKELPKVRIVFFTDVFSSENTLLHSAKVTLVFIRSSDKKLQLCPKIMIDKLLPFFNEI